MYLIENLEINGRFFILCIGILLKNKIKVFNNKNNDAVIASLNFLFATSDENIFLYTYELKFTTFLIIESLNFSKFSASFFIQKNDVYQLTISCGKKKITISCIYKLLPFSIQSLCHNFTNLEYLEKPTTLLKKFGINYTGEASSKYFNEKNSYKAYTELRSLTSYIEKRVENNCVILQQSLINFKNIFLKPFNLDLIKLNLVSLSSLSFYVYFKYFNKYKVKRSIKKEDEIYLRDSYFGGRCEVFGNKREDERVFYFDFPGMYASCMLERNVYGECRLVYDVSENIEIPGFYNIQWYSNISQPVLPHHNIINSKLLFTNGFGSGTYWFEEIILFKKYGGVVLKINSALIYENFDFIFKDFINYFNAFKLSSALYKSLSKLIINSFYGRCGLKPADEIYLFIDKYKEFEKINELNAQGLITIKKIDEINSTWFLTLKLERGTYKTLFQNKFIASMQKEKSPNIAIASSIAAKARVKLYEAFKDIEKNNGRVLYCDTDGIFAAYTNDVAGQEHGSVFWPKASAETTIVDSLFISPKTYSLQYENKFITKIKGVSRDYISFKELKEKILNRENALNVSVAELYFNKCFLYKKINNKSIKLLAYDKRMFVNNMYDTVPYYYKNGVYTTGI